MPGSTIDPVTRKELTDELRAMAGDGDLPRLQQGLARWDTFWEIAPRGNSEGPPQHIQPVSRLPFEFEHVLSAAAAGGHVKVVEYLLDERGLEVSPPAIRGATLRKRSEVLRLFMDRGWDINAPIAGGNTCSVLSEFIWREEHVRWLLQHGADPYMVSAGGNNDIPSKAGRYAPVNVFRALREFGVNFARTNALHAAAGSHVRGRIEVMTYLLDEAGVSVNQVEHGTWDGVTLCGLGEET
ncbi:hypothetical protein ACJ41O_012106 [Fusarium nematophilum]